MYINKFLSYLPKLIMNHMFCTKLTPMVRLGYVGISLKLQW